MNNNEAQYEQSSRDYFSRLMFGDRFFPQVADTDSDSDVQGNNIEKVQIADEDHAPSPSHLQEYRQSDDPFAWILPVRENRNQPEGQIAQLKEVLETIDYNELFENVDSLIATAKQFQPLLDKILPFIKSFTKR